jgi:hydroxymethylglutaryl-CoA synthase
MCLATACRPRSGPNLDGWQGGLPIKEKAVPGLDEDVATMSIEAARNAMQRAGIAPTQIRAVWVGSESHPYAVKPTSTMVAEAIGAVPNVQAADWQFACKAGTEAMVAAIGLVGSGMANYALAIGMDTAQGRPGMPWSTPPGRVGQPLCWVRRKIPWL